MDNNNAFRIILIVAMVLYVLSPIDLCFGPLDDIIAVVAGCIVQGKIGRSAGKTHDDDPEEDDSTIYTEEDSDENKDWYNQE